MGSVVFLFLFGYPIRGWEVSGMYVLPSFHCVLCVFLTMWRPRYLLRVCCCFGSSKSPGNICFLSRAVFGFCWYGG